MAPTIFLIVCVISIILTVIISAVSAGKNVAYKKTVYDEARRGFSVWIENSDYPEEEVLKEFTPLKL